MELHPAARDAQLHRGADLHGRRAGEDPRHPTQKPVAVLRRLVEWGSRPGDLVLDPVMGVGSTGAAALAAARRFVGIEIDPGYADAAARRLGAIRREPAPGSGGADGP
jgi:DNA modification methylase